MQTLLTGTPLAWTLNEVRALRRFSIDEGYRQRRVQLRAVYADEPSAVAWIETHSGTWRLPSVLLPWAVEVDERMARVLGRDEVFPCTATFWHLANGAWEIEISPGIT
ncbi:hypothetical protein AB0M10_15310 [Streptomyces sp. NPDC051840]|uniref:hypothetical protein n=1 Tax=Streptomyces sp. NPDC051840 TaxID=3154752 RepID=UPI00342D9D4C